MNYNPGTMLRVPTRAALAYTAFGWACIGADPSFPVSIPTRLNPAHQYFIQARINGSDPVLCNVDSGGGDRLYLDRGRAEKMGIKPSASGKSAGANDSTMKEDLRSVVTLEAFGVTIPNQVVLLQNRPYEEFSCVIGQTVFRDYVVEVDYDAQALRLHDATRFRYSGPGQTLAMTMQDGNPLVEATLSTPNGNPSAHALWLIQEAVLPWSSSASGTLT